MFTTRLALAVSCCLRRAPRAAPIAGLSPACSSRRARRRRSACRAATAGAFDLAEYRGKVVVLEFGYTHCAEVCPVSLASLAQARKLLGADADKLQVVFVTVDPARDSAAAPARLPGAVRPELHRRHRQRSSRSTRCSRPTASRPRSEWSGGSKTDYMMSPLVLPVFRRHARHAARADAVRPPGRRDRARRPAPAAQLMATMPGLRRHPARLAAWPPCLALALAVGRAGAARMPPRATSCSRSRRAPGRAAWPATRSRSCRRWCTLTLGVQDVLLLRNSDTVPQHVRPGADHAGPGLPAAVRAGVREPVRLHRARQRADDGVGGGDARSAAWNGCKWRLAALARDSLSRTVTR